MQQDSSRKLYEKYFSLTVDTITVTLKDGKMFRGVFTGFFHGDEFSDEHFITRWYLASNGKPCTASNGTYINQEDIACVLFHDGSTMEFV